MWCSREDDKKDELHSEGAFSGGRIECLGLSSSFTRCRPWKGGIDTMNVNLMLLNFGVRSGHLAKAGSLGCISCQSLF